MDEWFEHRTTWGDTHLVRLAAINDVHCCHKHTHCVCLILHGGHELRLDAFDGASAGEKASELSRSIKRRLTKKGD